jgi:hypothetical protein
MAADRSFVQAHRVARERLESVVSRLSDDDLRRELSDGWTVAAALAHLAFWDRRALVLLDRWTQRGETPRPSPIDVDVANDAVHYLIRLIPPRTAADEAVAAAAAIDRALEELDDETLEAVRAIDSPKLDRSEHRIEHLNQIEHLLSNR